MKAKTLDFCCIFFVLFAISFSNAYPYEEPEEAEPGNGYPQTFYCDDPGIRCEGVRVTCPQQCPLFKPTDNEAKACYVNCNAKNCEAVCKHRKPNCNGIGSACYDPRFVGGDGVMFYFHGKTNEHFSLVSDHNLQINARFIGLRPKGRSRDNTWIQSLALMFGSHTLTISANKVAHWDENIDQLALSYDGSPVVIRKGHLSAWSAPDRCLSIERTAMVNSISVTLSGVLEMFVGVVIVTREDDNKHNYQIPSDDCFTHLEVQFKFLKLSKAVDGVLGQTYRPDFKNPVKRGVPMPVMGGEDRFKTSTLLSYDCRQCRFLGGVHEAYKELELDSSVVVDCSSKMSKGRGFVCRR